MDEDNDDESVYPGLSAIPLETVASRHLQALHHGH